ncbi:hypothetical protein SAY87_008517 [Trapa incisa]|uniref:non-specific serine/threonine protein kinase n=1 Tax=Trapa incisa TaxID=236973 RepID=A0AAN7Q0W3_9MYRT|nr:hypothetical protein SAY87_008517 [Trapa incisa]
MSLAVEIDFSENYLSGGIPVELANITGLKLLYLFQNELTGRIPDVLTSLKNLTKLDLSINNLTGPIPLGFQYMSKLIMLQLFHNSLSGTIPQRLGIYSPLWVVNLSENLLTGEIPRHLCRNSSLILLNLGSNSLTGSIPPGIVNCKSLIQLQLVGNSLEGDLPPELCKLANLSTVELDQNRLSGPIPREIGTCRSLQRLHLSENYFSSELPREIGNLSKLVTFNVSSNSLSGQVPPEIFGCKLLQRLDLSRNNFTGPLPGEIGSLSQLELLKLSDNQFTGTIPVELGMLSRLTELQMGGNLFSGDIPQEIGSLKSLQIALNLSFNNLSGVIPPMLGNLWMLMNILLNNNHLTGPIPASFLSLSSLISCNFSYNDLWGPLPSPSVLDNMSISSFLGNRGLCGGPLDSCDSSTDSIHLPPVSNSRNPRLGKIMAIAAAAIGGVSIILIAAILYLMRWPVETVTPLQVKPLNSSLAPDIYFPPKDGFTFQELVLATDNFGESFIIGRGACGTVYRAELPTGHTIAVKKLDPSREGNDNNVDDSFRAEIHTLGKIRHRNIVKLYGFCYHQGSNLLLYEYMAKGSLGELLHGSPRTLDWRKRFKIALGAAEGLAYLHHDCKPRIIHRDIKSNNILLDENLEAHVGDFGLAKVIDVLQSKTMSAIAGSYGYIAPEYAYTMKVTEKCDIFSYGEVLLELLTGRMPVQPLDQCGDLVTWVRRYIKQHSLSPGILDQCMVDVQGVNIVSHMITVLKIALLCTSMSPVDRPTMRQVVRMLIESAEQEGNLHIHDSSDRTEYEIQ